MSAVTDVEAFDVLRSSVRLPSGETVSYVDVGAGRPALFVHGLGTNAYLWRNVIAGLRGERRCIAIDLPLHGRSPVADDQDLSLAAFAAVLEGTCAALGLDRVDLVANDTGGAVAQIFAAAHPERLSTFTLTNCEAHDNIPNEAFKGTVELARRGELAPMAVQMVLDIATSRTSGRSIAVNYEHPDRLDDDTIRAYMEPVAGTLRAARLFERLITSLDSAELLAAEEGLRRLDVPTLIVWGTGDFHFGVEWAYWLRDLIPGACDVVELPGAKLFFPDERAEELVTELRRHWEAHPAASASGAVRQ